MIKRHPLFHNPLTRSFFKWCSFFSSIFLCMWGTARTTIRDAHLINMSTLVAACRGVYQDSGSPPSMHAEEYSSSPMKLNKAM